MNDFILGATVVAAAVAGLAFLRFWRKTRERLFVFFAVSFWLLSVNWLALAFYRQTEVSTALYLIRLLAFSLILIGIVDKNRAGRVP